MEQKISELVRKKEEQKNRKVRDQRLTKLFIYVEGTITTNKK